MARAGSSLNDSGPVAPHSLQLTASIARSWSTAITSRSSLAQNGQDSGFIGKSITPGGAFGNWAMAVLWICYQSEKALGDAEITLCLHRKEFRLLARQRRYRNKKIDLAV